MIKKGEAMLKPFPGARIEKGSIQITIGLSNRLLDLNPSLGK